MSRSARLPFLRDLALGSRLGALRGLLRRYQDDPYVRGRAEQVIGGLLVADGLVGLENPLDGRRSRPGIFGALGGVVVAGVWLGLSLWLFSLADGPHLQDPVTTSGTVSAVLSSGSSNSCGLQVRFEVDGRSYLVRSAASSSDLCSRTVGATESVQYESGNPNRSRLPDSGVPGLFKVVFLGVGVVLLLASGLSLLLRLASLIGGAWLLRHGRRLATSAPSTQADALLADLEAQARSILAGGRQALAGLGATLAGAAASVAAPAAPAPAPPAGWYPTGDGQLRWWDGSAWTAHVQAPAPPPE